MGRDERVYVEPENFKPERWIDVDSGKLYQYKFPVFQGGQRLCMGRDLALLETRLCISELLQRYKFTFVGTPPRVLYSASIPLLFNGDLTIRFEKRC